MTGFGQTGPYRERPGYDFMIQGMGGMMSVTGERDDLPGGGPQRVGVPIADIITGMYATIAVCAALAHRAETGVGQHLDLALLDSPGRGARQPGDELPRDRRSRPARSATRIRTSCPTSRSAPRTATVILACGNDNLFRKFCEVAGCAGSSPTIRASPPTASASRTASSSRALLQEIFAKRTTREWVELLEAAGVPNGPINDLAQVFEEPQVKARGVKIELDHPIAGKVPLVASPMRFSGTPLEHKLPPPMLGQHTDEILREVLQTRRRGNRAAARGENRLDAGTGDW